MKHTPAPWAIHRHKEQDNPRKGYIIIESKLINAKNIATVIDCTGMEKGEAEANARLIAYAPRMFELISLLVEYSNSFDEPQFMKAKLSDLITAINTPIK